MLRRANISCLPEVGRPSSLPGTILSATGLTKFSSVCDSPRLSAKTFLTPEPSWMKRISSNPKVEEVEKARKNYNKTLNKKRNQQIKYAAQHMEFEEGQGEDSLLQGNTRRRERRATGISSSSTRPDKAACTRDQGKPTPADSIDDTPASYSPGSTSTSQSRIQPQSDPCHRPGSSPNNSLAPSPYFEGYNLQPQALRDIEQDLIEALGDDYPSSLSQGGRNTAVSVISEQVFLPYIRHLLELFPKPW